MIYISASFDFGPSHLCGLSALSFLFRNDVLKFSIRTLQEMYSYQYGEYNNSYPRGGAFELQEIIPNLLMSDSSLDM